MNPLRKDLSTRDFNALLCLHSQKLLETATAELTPIGFQVHTVSTPEQAIDHLYSHPYDVLVVSDDFGGGDAETHPVLVQLSSLPLDLRRKIFVVLIGSDLTPHSKMQAFALSVEMVLRPQDVANLKVSVGQGLSAYQQIYAAFNSVNHALQKVG